MLPYTPYLFPPFSQQAGHETADVGRRYRHDPPFPEDAMNLRNRPFWIGEMLNDVEYRHFVKRAFPEVRLLERPVDDRKIPLPLGIPIRKPRQLKSLDLPSQLLRDLEEKARGAADVEEIPFPHQPADDVHPSPERRLDVLLVLEVFPIAVEHRVASPERGVAVIFLIIDPVQHAFLQAWVDILEPAFPALHDGEAVNPHGRPWRISPAQVLPHPLKII